MSTRNKRPVSFPEATKVKAGQLDEDWRTEGACRQGHDPELWYPSSTREGQVGVAICHTCPVAQVCLNYALAHDERHGTWGGFTEWQRDARFRRRALKAVV